MQNYNDFLRDRIKNLADEISNNISGTEPDVPAVANMSREIYSYCKVIDHLENSGSFAPPQHK